MIIVCDNINPTLSQQTEKNCEKGISTDFKKNGSGEWFFLSDFVELQKISIPLADSKATPNYSRMVNIKWVNMMK